MKLEVFALSLTFEAEESISVKNSPDGLGRPAKLDCALILSFVSFLFDSWDFKAFLALLRLRVSSLLLEFLRDFRVFEPS